MSASSGAGIPAVRRLGWRSIQDPAGASCLHGAAREESGAAPGGP
jgi:hypothetical protein